MRQRILRAGLTAAALAAALVLGAETGAPTMAAQQPAADAGKLADETDRAAIAHVLNRIGFGPRPGDIDRVQAVGLAAYIDQQLHPERIDDAAMRERLAGLSTLALSSREIAEQFALPAIQARRERQRAAAGSEAVPPAMPAAPPSAAPAQRPPEAVQRANRVLAELTAQKVLRAVYSERQLEEVLTDFWFNHFNVDARKGQTRFLLTEYERDAIRPHVLGRFRDLLEATAKSPAMLFYLDNWMSADPNGPHLDQPARRANRGGLRGSGRGRVLVPVIPQRPPNVRPNMRRGLNENYARELMELHTLGVDGGYTQKDVTEVARAFTGWTIQNPRAGGGYVFDSRIHDRGEKVVLGHVIDAGGEGDGEEVLDILASHPATARFIATKLARRFVSDDPPAALVDRVAARFRQTDGDLRAVVQTLLTSPELLAPETRRAKVKTPFEFVVSAVRATGIDAQAPAPLARALQELGMPLYMCQPPTGYKDTADAWVNSGALIGRMNFALQLAGGFRGRPGVPLRAGTDAGPNGVRADAAVLSNRIVDDVLNGDVSAATRETLAKATTAQQMVALTLGSPEFQRR